MRIGPWQINSWHSGSLIGAALAISFAATAQAAIVVNIDKSAQRMTVAVDGATRYVWPVSTGRAGYDTPNGTFKVNRMDADHLSQEWDNAPMPHTMFFDMHGHAIHGFFDVKHLGSPVSHGCVRLAPANAATLFALVQGQGMSQTTVVVSGQAPARGGEEMARRRRQPSRSQRSRRKPRRPVMTINRRRRSPIRRRPTGDHRKLITARCTTRLTRRRHRDITDRCRSLTTDRSSLITRSSRRVTIRRSRRRSMCCGRRGCTEFCCHANAGHSAPSIRITQAAIGRAQCHDRCCLQRAVCHRSRAAKKIARHGVRPGATSRRHSRSESRRRV